MPNPDQILQAMADKVRWLGAKNQEYKQLAEDRAEAERNHNVLFAERLLRLKGEHAATILRDIVKGDKGVADAKFKLDVAEAMVKACQQSMRSLTAWIDVDRSELSWNKAEMGRS